MSIRNRSRALRAVTRDRFQSQQVRLFNLQEDERERDDLLKKCGATPINPVIKEHREFFATKKLLGFLFWWMISALPVELSRHTEIGTTMTAVVMERMGIPSESY